MRIPALFTRTLLALLIVVLIGAVPASATDGGANQVVLVTTTADGSSLERSELQFTLLGGPTVGSENLAQATSDACSGCTSIAVAVQAVVATGGPSTVIPHNAAVAANSGCTDCASYAYAYQYVLTTHGSVYLSPAGHARVAELRAEIADAAAAGLAFDALTARLDELSAEFRAVVDQDLMAPAGLRGLATRSIDTAPAS